MHIFLCKAPIFTSTLSVYACSEFYKFNNIQSTGKFSKYPNRTANFPNIPIRLEKLPVTH